MWPIYRILGISLTVILGAFANMQKLRLVYLSVCQHGTTRLPPDEFSLNFMFEYFSKIC